MRCSVIFDLHKLNSFGQKNPLGNDLYTNKSRRIPY